MSEMSLVSSRKFKLENALRKGRSGAKAAIELSEDPNKFLSTVQIGITLIGILLGVYSGENLTNDLSAWLSGWDFIQPYADKIAVGMIVLAVTYLSIVLGELIPKRLGMIFPEPIALVLARPMKIVATLTSPFVKLLTLTNDLILNIFGIRMNMDSKISEEEIKSIIKESAAGGEIQDIEQNIVERVFELGDRKVNTLLTYRNDIVFLDVSDDWQTVRTKINEEKHSAYPVCENNDIDNILGIVLLKDLFSNFDEQAFELRDFIKTPLYLNENVYAYKVLELFKTRKVHYGIIIDEYGSTVGIITMDDVVDALVGDVTEEDQEEYSIVKRDDNSWLVDGQFSIIEFLKNFPPEQEIDYEDKYTTVAGLMIYQSESLPEVGDKIQIPPYELEVMDKDGQRIDKILVSKK
jgi:putative hemolysin